MGMLVWSPLAGGFLSGKYRTDDAKGRRAGGNFPPVEPKRGERCLQALQVVADELGSSPAQVALAWLLTRSSVTSVIVGARTQDQLLTNLSATELTLNKAHVFLLDEASALSAEFPGWMIQFSTQDRLTPPVKG
ncbi:L-glyceraldehyde 3-phosphate reductase [compost metagenome]